ncbi:protein transport protein sec31-like [Rhododendron vialii]|uniref:protein transport protein sec31-like n=1 Tax=Rhododendron vialii TaxID=182163 RepID=UPI00265FC435|nr:protein transport protein sec31-like [Rhododendron vialii]
MYKKKRKTTRGENQRRQTYHRPLPFSSTYRVSLSLSPTPTAPPASSTSLPPASSTKFKTPTTTSPPPPPPTPRAFGYILEVSLRRMDELSPHGLSGTVSFCQTFAQCSGRPSHDSLKLENLSMIMPNFAPH